MAVQEALQEALVAVEGGAGADTRAFRACCVHAGDPDVRARRRRNAGRPTPPTSNAEVLRPHAETPSASRTRYYPIRASAQASPISSTDATCAVFMESPGSLTFEVQDVPAIAAAAHASSVPPLLDNTWSAGVYFKPFEHGVDLSVQALTKYQCGHADAFLGAVLAATPEAARRVDAAYAELGLGASPDDAYLVLRGMRTMARAAGAARRLGA